MKKIKIVNKRTFVIFIFFILLLTGTLFFLTYKIVQFNSTKNQVVQQVAIEDLSSSKGSLSSMNSEKPVQADANTSAQEDKMPVEPAQTNTEYKNQQYAYTIAYPDNWFLNSDSSETKFQPMDIAGKSIYVGGKTFWSNYKNINDFPTDQKPADFHLLGLTIYQTQGISSDEMAANLGFDQDSISKKMEFAGKEISGSQYFVADLDGNNSQEIIIFQKDQSSYVFNISSPDSDAQATSTMEDIARTISWK